MTNRRIDAYARPLRVVLLAVVGLGLGCATTGNDEAGEIPAHPFPRWVSHLETGETGMDEVASVFGNPGEIQQSVRGGLRWRYAYAEVHWAPDDPSRPAVAADGRPIEAEETWVDRTVEGIAATGRFLDGLLFYPARQPRGPRTRTMDATIHELELSFTVDGVLDHYRYTPRRDRIRVPVD